MISTEELRSLQKCKIFKRKCEQGIQFLLQRIDIDINTYNKNEVIVTEGDQAYRLGIILEGSVEVKKIFPSGKSISMARLKAGETFGEAVLFSAENYYPATIIAQNKSKIIFISKNEMEKLISIDRQIAVTFLETLSDRLFMLNKKIQIMSLDTLRKKIALFLLEESGRRQDLSFKLPYNREVWAQHLGVARPSLSRELANMQEEGLIILNKKDVRILDVEALEEELIQD